MDRFSFLAGAGLVVQLILVFIMGRVARRQFLENATFERVFRIITEISGIAWVIAALSYGLTLVFTWVQFMALASTSMDVTMIAMAVTSVGLATMGMVTGRRLVRM